MEMDISEPKLRNNIAAYNILVATSQMHKVKIYNTYNSQKSSRAI